MRADVTAAAHRTGRALPGGVAVALALEVAALAVVIAVDQFHSLDFDVYRAASAAWWNGDTIHDLPKVQTPVGPTAVPFINPPIAAVLLAPVTLLPRALAIAVWYAVTLAALAYTVHLFARVVAARFPALTAGRITLAALPALTLLGPVRDELAFGQMNMVLMAMVAADCLGPPDRRGRGLLTGLAIGIKLIPGVFLLFFLLRRDVRALVQAGAAFVLATALGFAAAFRDSIEYWTTVLPEGDPIVLRFGWSWSPNQSLVGLTERFHWVPLGPVVLVLLYAAVLALTVLVMHRMFRVPGYGTAAALLVNAGLALLLAPTSWPYRWVWVAPALLLVTALAVERRDVLLGGATAFAAAVFYLDPPWLMQRYDGSERHWNVAEYLAGNAYPLIALTALGLLATVRPPLPSAGPAGSDPAEAPAGDDSREPARPRS